MANKKDKKEKPKAPSLVMALFVDLFIRNWFISLLFVIVVGSAISQTYASHKTRLLTAELQKLKQNANNYQVNWESARLELTSLREADRISGLAKKQLEMVEVNTKNEKVITL